MRRIASLLAGASMAAVAILMFSVGVIGVFEILQAPFLQRCSFHVLESEIRPAAASQGGFMLSVTLQATRSGIRFDREIHNEDYGELLIMQRGLRPRSVVSGRIRPSDSHVILESEVLKPVFFLLLPLAATPYGLIRLGAHNITQAFASHSESSPAKKFFATWEVRLFGWFLVWLGALCVFMFFTTSIPIRDWLRSGYWAPTEATIELSRPVTTRDSDSVSTYPEVLYRYEWHGETHRSSRIGDRAGNSDSRTDAFLARNPAGSARTCLVNPASPGEAMLERSLSLSMFREPAVALGGAALFLCFGLLVLFSRHQITS